MRRQHRLRLDALDPVLAFLDPLRQIPQEEVDEHAANRTVLAAVGSGAEGRGDALDGNDRRGAYRDFLSRYAGGEHLARPKLLHERWRVCQQPQVMQDLRHAVVREHSQLSDAAREERVRLWRRYVLLRVAGRRRRGKRRPRFRGQDLRALPEEDCFVFVSYRQSVVWSS